MIRPKIPINEHQRLDALKSYSILDSLPEKEYDEITFLASEICQTPISLISLIDEGRQWFKSNHGLDAKFTPRELAFCAHAINDPENVLIVPDSREDERFYDNPLVTGNPNVIFYAGIPLVNAGGYSLGTLCVIDHKPNDLNAGQIKALKALSNQLLKLLELRKASIDLETHIHELKAQNIGLNEFARLAAHDIKSPLNSIITLTDLLKYEYANKLTPEIKELIELIGDSSENLTELIDGILQYSKDSNLLLKNREKIDAYELIGETIQLVDSKQQAIYEFENDEPCIVFTNKVAFQQILINLLSNSIKYNDKLQTDLS